MVRSKTDTRKSSSKAAAAKAPARTVKKAVSISKAVDKRSLFKQWNQLFALVFAVEAVLVVAFGSAKTVGIVMSYPALDALASDAAKHDVYGVAIRHLFDVRLSWLIAFFLMVFAVVHILSATKWRKLYEKSLENGVHAARWLTFGVGGATMVMTIGLLSGLNDVAAIRFMGFTVAIAAVSALAVELLGPGRPGLSRLLKIVAGFSAILPWLLLATIIFAVQRYGGKLPLYMYGVMASMLLFTVATGLGAWFSWKGKSILADALYIEKVYMLLGLAAATALALQLFAGALL